MITDDNIIGHGKADLEWTRNFFLRILEKGIKKIFFAQSSIIFGEDPELIRLASRAGLKIVFIGMESINPETLKSYGKNINLKRLQQSRYQELINRIRKGGIAFLGAFVLGSDEDYLSVFDSTLKFIKSSHIDVLQITKPTPLPGTQLRKMLQKEKRLFKQDLPKAWNDYRFSRLHFEPAHMSIEEVYEEYACIKENYFTFWETLKRTFYTLFDTKSLIASILAYKFNSSYCKAFKNSEHYRKYKNINLKKKFATDKERR